MRSIGRCMERVSSDWGILEDGSFVIKEEVVNKLFKGRSCGRCSFYLDIDSDCLAILLKRFPLHLHVKKNENQSTVKSMPFQETSIVVAHEHERTILHR